MTYFLCQLTQVISRARAAQVLEPRFGRTSEKRVEARRFEMPVVGEGVGNLWLVLVMALAKIVPSRPEPFGHHFVDALHGVERLF